MLGLIQPYEPRSSLRYPPGANVVIVEVDLEDVGLRKLHALSIRMGELSLVRPHQPSLVHRREDAGGGGAQKRVQMEAGDVLRKKDHRGFPLLMVGCPQWVGDTAHISDHFVF